MNNDLPSFGINYGEMIDSIQRRQDELAGKFDAGDIFSYLKRRVLSFQHSLSNEEETGIQLANFGIAAEIHIRSIGYKNPNLIEFSGLDPQGQAVTLVQHISQLNFMLVAVKPFKEEPFRIGFR